MRDVEKYKQDRYSPASLKASLQAMLRLLSLTMIMSCIVFNPDLYMIRASIASYQENCEASP